MTESPVNPYPQTPQQVAAAVLDAIQARPEAFDMGYWFMSPSTDQLPPDAEPSCGTTMCVAGWAAHLTGWTLDHSHARKPGVKRWVEDVAAEALGRDVVSETQLFWLCPDDAIAVLREIAGR